MLGRPRHNFPNLACEKISAYWKSKGAEVELLTDYNQISDFNTVYVSKVFTDTPIPTFPESPGTTIHYGGTGFNYDCAEPFPDYIEHTKPDYDLYSSVIQGKNTVYSNAAIGFLMRGCFRWCPYCVNRNATHVHLHSPLEEFDDPERGRLIFLDDNFFGYAE